MAGTSFEIRLSSAQSGDIDFCERYNDGAIALCHQPPEKTVTKTEILAALKNLTAEERL